MAKRIIAIPIDRLCPHCSKGRLISEGLRRSIVLGEFTGKSYRVCNQCEREVQTSERFIGVEIDIPEDNTPGLFDQVSDYTAEQIDSIVRPSESYLQ